MFLSSNCLIFTVQSVDWLKLGNSETSLSLNQNVLFFFFFPNPIRCLIFKSHKTNEKWSTAQKSSWLQPMHGQMVQSAFVFAIFFPSGGRLCTSWCLDYRDGMEQSWIVQFETLEILIFNGRVEDLQGISQPFSPDASTFCTFPVVKKPAVLLCCDGSELRLSCILKYRSLVPEFLWPWPGSFWCFVVLTFGCRGFPDLFLYLLFNLSDRVNTQTHRLGRQNWTGVLFLP